MTKKKQEPIDELAARVLEEVNFENSSPAEEECQPEIPPTIPGVIDSPELAKEAHDAVGAMDIAALKAELKSQIMNELKDDQVKRMELEKERRERETKEQYNYIQRMKASPDPWVDIIGWVRDSHGVRTELEWNTAFVDYLRAEGVTGVDDDQVVQKWVAIMMHEMAARMDDEQEEASEFAG